MTTPPNDDGYVYASDDTLYEYRSSLRSDLDELATAKDQLTDEFDLTPEQRKQILRRMRDRYVLRSVGLSRNDRHELDASNYSAALDALEGMFVPRGEPIRRNDVLGIHSQLLDGILRNRSEIGALRSRDVDLNQDGAVPEHYDVPRLMDEYSDWLSRATIPPVGDPLVVASVAHVWLTRIHPFVNGNGRTARLVMALILAREGYPLVSITDADRDAYMDALRASDDFDISDFLKLTIIAADEALRRYRELAEQMKQGQRSVMNVAQRVDKRIEINDQNDYHLWSLEVKSLIGEFQVARGHFNRSVTHINISDIWKYEPFLPSYKFSGLRNRRPPSRTGIFALQIISRRQNRRYIVRYQFFAAFASDAMAEHADIGLLISRDATDERDHKWDYVMLDDMPAGVPRPDIRELGYSTDSQEWFVRRENGIEPIQMEKIAPEFINDVVKCEFDRN